MSYTGRLIAGTVLVLFVTLAVVMIGVDRTVRRHVEIALRASLEREARVMLENLPTDSDQLAEQVRALAAAADARVTVTDGLGRVLADSHEPADDLNRREPRADRPEIEAALRTGTGSSLRRSGPPGARAVYVAVAGGPGALRIAVPLDRVRSVTRTVLSPAIVALLVALGLGILLATWSGRRLARPLAEAATAARAIAAGAPPAFPWSGIPDVDRLVADLRDMHRQLGERYDALHRRQAETAAIVEAMVEGVLASDDKGRIVSANPAARRLLGYGHRDELPELPLLFRAREARDAVLAALRGEQVAGREVDVRERICLLNARPLPSGGAVVVLHDLTRLRHLETVRRDFVANVSHELKTPLTAVAGYTETLLADDVDPATGRRFLETILANARRMQRLVDDQLDLSRIESGRWTPQPTAVDAAQACRDAWALVEPARSRTARLVLETGPATIWADADALRQILRNLYENAIRHTPPDGTVTARTATDGAGSRLTIEDTGSGIPSEHLPRIFERFYRVDAGRSRDAGGTGLGLAIVRHLTEAHGGRVWAESQLGRGTAIHCWFPDPSAVTES